MYIPREEAAQKFCPLIEGPCKVTQCMAWQEDNGRLIVGYVMSKYPERDRVQGKDKVVTYVIKPHKLPEPPDQWKWIEPAPDLEQNPNATRKCRRMVTCGECKAFNINVEVSV